MEFRKDQWLLLGAGFVSLLFILVPVLRPFALPLIYLNTHLHELAHALAALGTGGRVDHIAVFANGSGVALTLGGIDWIIASAGYPGTALIGAALILAGGSEKVAKGALIGLGSAMALSLVLFVRGDWVGILTALVWIVLLLGLGAILKGPVLIFVIQFLGLQLALTSFESIAYLVQISALTETRSDAMNMEKMTRIPAVVWSVLWAFLSLAVVAMSLKMSWKGGVVERTA
ncbi:MAG: M50 family metallopeptidase, partial [Fimbriimonadaceae bacterium]|jgi:hypothetical protein|nr:M50 family metallopeptidase [Fimbriimonadaceae bacterium]